MKLNDFPLPRVCLFATFSAASLCFTPLEAAAAEYARYVNLVGCRSQPTADGKDAAVINPAASSATILSPVLGQYQSTLVCDLAMPREATQLSSVTLEYSSQAGNSSYHTRFPSVPLVLRIYLSAHERSTRFSSLPTGRPSLLTQEIGSCTVPAPPPDTGLNFCPATVNQTLIPFTAAARDSRGYTRMVLRDSMSATATITMPVGYGAEGAHGEYAKVHRLRVVYQAP
jgi:hypothetical protein